MQKTSRQISEAKFYDAWVPDLKLNQVDLENNFSVGAPENRLAKEIFGDLKGKRILELGCGPGETAVYWAKCGAKVDAVDVSSKMVEFGKKLAKSHKLHQKCHFQSMVAEDLKFKSGTFDYVFGSNVLHHIDHEKAISEIHRVLKKGGKAIFVDPLAYNPVIEAYRKIAYETRTPNEKPLKFSDVKKFKKKFAEVEHREFHFLTLFLFLWFYIVEKSNPNKEKYWKKILKVKGAEKAVLGVLCRMDEIVLKIFPPFRYWCWNIMTIVQK